VNNKTVFILGAGFSYPASIPLQGHLLKEILNYKSDDYTESAVLIAQDALKNFIIELFGKQKNIILEDIFTILDRGVIGKERFKDYTWQKLYEIRGQLVYLILFIISKRMKSVPEKVKNTYISFCKKIIQMRRSHGQKSDSIAVISSNWDTLFEIFINQAFNSKQRLDMGIDYCAYTHFFHDGGISHTNLKTTGIFNIKLLKLHGSLNWLYCSSCGRLYVDDKDNIGIQNKECTFCKTSSGIPNLILEPLIITPTFLKEFTNLHIKNIWQNAFIELQGASHVIFIGYSLPLADFEFKYFLKKGIRKSANIQAVLSNKDKTNGTKKRYLSFFGKEKVRFDFDELEGWLQANL
jgi:NAD-dependent SIR2 family protein deacetylase